MSAVDELKQNVDMTEKKQDTHKPAVAARLEKEAGDLKAKRQSLSKDDVDHKLKEAEERRQKELEAKVEKAKELEGTKGKVDQAAAAKDAPPAGKELPNSPVNAGAK